MSSTPAPTSPYKPSPLSFNPPRPSPFRRSGSALAPRASPTTSPSRPADARPTTPSRLSPAKESPFRRSTSSVRSNGETPPPAADDAATPADTPEKPGLGSPFLTTRKTTLSPDAPASPTRPPIQRNITSHTVTTESTTIKAPDSPPMARRHTPAATANFRGGGSDPLAHMPPALLHSMRESFSVLDRANSGTVTGADVQDALAQIGLDNGPASLHAYFPPSQPQSLNLASYLHMMASLLAPMSREQELLAAFEAFDDADDGQIDAAELAEALLHTAPDAGEQMLTEREVERVVEGFRGRRALGKKGKGALGRGDVFRYREFVGSVCGGGPAKEASGEATA